MKDMRVTKRKGFTLVELLIVIVVIGILSAMMMMSSSEAMSSARASTITSNMRSLQTAGLAYCADNMNKFNKRNVDAPSIDDIFRYLKEDENSKIDAPSGAWTIQVDKNGNNFLGLYIKCDLTKFKADDRVKKKIAGRAAALGLLAKTNNNSSVDDSFYGADGTYGNNIYIRIL